MTEVLAERPEDTFALGRAIGRAAHAGTVVALIGDLGAGKTVFAKGVGEGLNVATRVTSPTFILVATHDTGRLPYWHADLYRLGDASELEHLGLEDMLEGGGVAVIEWADRFADLLPDDRLEVHLGDAQMGRLIRLVATGPLHAHLEAAAHE